MDSYFDRLMQEADETLFGLFGTKHCYIDTDGRQVPDLDVCISHNVTVAGADGLFRPVQVMAEIRLCQLPKPRAGAVLADACARYRLDERLDSDGQIERWSLIPAR